MPSLLGPSRHGEGTSDGWDGWRGQCESMEGRVQRCCRAQWPGLVSFLLGETRTSYEAAGVVPLCTVLYCSFAAASGACTLRRTRVTGASSEIVSASGALLVLRVCLHVVLHFRPVPLSGCSPSSLELLYRYQCSDTGCLPSEWRESGIVSLYSRRLVSGPCLGAR